jgi:pyruvate dehydrogenase E1 component alpha subunit
MEAVAVGVSLALGPDDAIASNHRGHAHCLARGADPGRTLAEILGRQNGYCQGKGGSMHIAVPELGILGTNGVVGGGIGIATGAALAAVMRGGHEVIVTYFGDGASNQGVLAESMNLAAVWRLPVIFVCENNQYAQSTRYVDVTAQPVIRRRGEAYGVTSIDVDGMDILAVYQAASQAVARARAGRGPTLIVADTYRFLGHMAGDTEMYRDAAEVAEWRKRDPIAGLARRLREAGLMDASGLEAAESEAREKVDAAEAFATASPAPALSVAFADVYAPEGNRR